MRVLLDATGAVQAVGSDELTPQAGQTGQTTTCALNDYKSADQAGQATGKPYDVTYDGAKFGYRNRAANTGEAATSTRAQIVAQLTAAVTAWPSATAAQKDAATLALLQLVLRVAQG